MAHQQQIDFCLSVKERNPKYFKGRLVLDIGSLDINGNNQYLFDDSGYIGVDLLPGRNVDFASKGHELHFPDCSFDVIISTECFEHDSYYEKTLKNILRMLKPGGLFLFSCATTGRPEHGTRRTTPHDAPFVHEFGDWADYYKNLEEDDIRQVLDIDNCFSEYEFSVQHDTHDLYFWGVKRGDFVSRCDYSFQMEGSSFRRLFGKIDQLLIDIDNCKKLISENAQLIERKQADLAVVEAKLNMILASKSWRLTRGFRMVSRLFRGKLVPFLAGIRRKAKRDY